MDLKGKDVIEAMEKTPENYIEVSMATVGKILYKIPFCGCGDPRAAIQAIKGILELFNRDERGWDWKEIEAWMKTMPDGIGYIVLYMLTEAQLMEHGGGVDGSWLTDEGKLVLKFLREFDCDEEVWNKAVTAFLNRL
jgi:hypothetical protein